MSVGDSLSILSPELTGLTITGITKDLVILSNGMEKHKKDEFDVDIYTSSYQESMLRLAIQRHFETDVTISIEKKAELRHWLYSL